MTIDFAIENGRNVKAGEIYGYFVQTFVMSAISMGATKGIGAYFDQFQKTGQRELGLAVAHGTFNGAMRYAQGGKFEHGFMSGFVSSLGGSFIQSNDGNMSLGAKVTMSAVIGGTAEKLGGGKFANGAVTGAYVMMFNHLASRPQRSPTKHTLNQSQIDALNSKIKDATFRHRSSWARYDPDSPDPAPYWEVSMDIEGVEPGTIYTAENVEIWLGKETLNVDIEYYSSKNMPAVNMIDSYGVDYSSGGRLRLTNSMPQWKGAIVEIEFHNRADRNKYWNFIKAHDRK